MKYGDFKFMTKCAIAFGNLNIKDLPELNNIRKQPLYGQGFIDAYESAEGISDEPMQIGEIRITYKETPHFKEKLKRQKKSNNFLKDLYKIGSKCAYFSWTGKSNPSKELNKIFKVGEQEALKAYKKKMDNVYKKQLNLYTKWANYRGT